MMISKSIAACYFFTILLIFLSSQSFCQNDYKAGYIVTLDFDTIPGKIKDRKSPPFERLYQKIRFKPVKGRKKKFRPDDISGYRRGETDFVSMWIHTYRESFVQRYQSIAGFGSLHFLKVIHQGHLSFYHWEYEDGEFNTIEYVPLFQRADKHQLVRVTQGIFGLKKKRLAEYFHDCPPLLQKIDSGEIKDALSIINFYNHYIENSKY